MYRNLRGAVAIVAIATPIAAQATPADVLQPIQAGAENVRFDRGDYIVDLPGRRAAVQIRAMPSDHGQLSFVVAVMNTGAEAINIDVGNIRVDGTAEPVSVLTRAQMEHKAANRAGWAKALMIVGGGLAAAAQVSQRNHYTAVAATPHSFAAVSASTACGGCQIAAGETMARTGSALDQIQYRLDETRQQLGEQMLQLTTVFPGQSYGGRIFLSRFKHAPTDQIRLNVQVGEETLTVAFRFAPAGAPMPAYRLAAAPVMLPAMVAPTYVPAMAMRPAIVTPSAPPAAMAMRTAATPIAFAPAAAVAAPGADAGTRSKWQRYYATLVASGVARGQAHTMADEEFGAVD